MLLVRSYEPSTWLCSRVMRFQSYPQLDPCSPQSLQQLSGQSIRLDHGGSWVQIRVYVSPRICIIYHVVVVVSITYNISCKNDCIPSRNADGPKLEYKQFFMWKNHRYARKKVENIIVHSLQCKYVILVLFLPPVPL